jgi:hypothetical protein
MGEINTREERDDFSSPLELTAANTAVNTLPKKKT